MLWFILSLRMVTPPTAALGPRTHSHSRLGAVVVSLFFLVLAGRLIYLTSQYAVNIFFWDQWAFNNATVFQHHSTWEMFRWQFWPHRLGAGALISKLIEPHFHWNSRAESYLACGIVILAAACALWLKHRLFGEVSVWDIAIPILYLSASQYSSLFVDTDLAHGSLPLLLITLYCLSWTIRSLISRYFAVLALNFVTTYTGFALFLGFLTPSLLLLDYWMNVDGKRRSALHSALAVMFSVASLASYFYGYKLQAGADCFSPRPHAPAQYFWYASLIVSNLWITSTGLFSRLIGFLVILCLIWTAYAGLRKMLAPTDRWAVHAITATLATFSLLFVFAAAYGRACLGISTAQSSRYTNYVVLGIFGAYLYVRSLRDETLRRTLSGVAIVALLATVPIRAQERNGMRWAFTVKRTWRQCYLQGGTIPECDALAGYKIDPEPAPVLQQKLDFLKQTHQNLFCTTQ